MADDTKKSKTETAPRPGFDAQGKPYPGVHPETGERVTVTLAGLKSEFGPKRGEEMYRQIASAAGGGQPQLAHRVDEDARDIGLDGADPEVRAKVEAILRGRE